MFSLLTPGSGRSYLDYLTRGGYGAVSAQSDSTIAHPNSAADTASVVGYQMWRIPFDIALHGYAFFDATTFAGNATVRMKVAMHTADATAKTVAIYNASTLCELELRSSSGGGSHGANSEASSVTGLANAGRIFRKALSADVVLSAGTYFLGILLESASAAGLSAGSYRTNFFARGLVDYNLGTAGGVMTSQTYSTFAFTDSPGSLNATTAATCACIQSLLWCSRIG